MSNVVNKHKFNNQSNNSIARVGQQQSINPRGSTPSENHSRGDHRLTYSNVARQGIPQTHESVINKSHTSGGNQVVQQVVLAQQPNLSSQVSSVNPSGPPMPAPTGPNSGANQLSVLQQPVPQVMPQSGARFPQQPFHHNQRPQQRQTLLPHRTQNTVPTSSGVVQTVQQNVGPTNLAHPQHTQQHPHHYYMISQMPQIQSQIINTQHMSHVNVPYTHANRGMHQPMPNQYAYHIPFTNQQAFGQQGYPYMYQTAYHTPHGQPTAQMIPPQMHAQRGAQVSNPVIQAPITVPGPVSGNNEITETPQMQPKPLQKRQRHVAIITDPNSGKNLDIEELASKDVSKNPTVVSATNESHSGASNPVNASSTSSPNPNANVDIALQFVTQVVQVATTPNPHTNTDTNINEIAVSPPNVTSKLETEPLVANSNTTISELSETNNYKSDSEPHLSDGNTLVNNTNSLISASISNFNTENDIKLFNNTSAQNLVENNSQNSVERSLGSEMSQNVLNGDTTDSSSNQLLVENDEIAKDHQKVNNNQRRKDMIKKADNNRITDELEDIKVMNDLDVTENTNVVEKLEPQTTADPSSSVMLSLSTEKVETLPNNETVCNNISENDLEEKNPENIVCNDIKQIEISNDDKITSSDLTIPISKTLPDLPYATDQWSPVNPDGKKHYDRDFLLAVRQKSENSLKKPESLNEALLSDIIRKPHQESSGTGLVSDDPFLPGYASKQGHYANRLMQPINRRQSQQSQRGHNEKQRKIISTSLTQDVKLHTTDNAWKPSKLAVNPNDPEEQETLDLLKRIRGILNKLTPQKYDDLVKQIMGFKVDTEDRLKRVLDLVFEKAVDEPAFCLQYANLCKHLSSFKVTVKKDDNEELVKFQNLLLSKCQKEFETDIYAGIEDLKERQKEIDDCTDLAKKKLLFEILDEDMRRARKRSLGNIKLIGQLYKLKMLSAIIMVQCIENLCKEKDDESLECLCTLLKTMGEQIEYEAAANPRITPFLENFFSMMDKIANQEIPGLKTSSRVKFMLRDVIDMRKNGWKARRDENLPKMIDEIHLEAKKEIEQRSLDLQQHTYQKKHDDKDRNKQRGGRQANDQNAEQWTVITGRKSQTMQSQNQIRSLDGKALRNQMVNTDTVQLGPQSGSWSLGSRGGAQTSQSRFPEKEVNRFSPLESGMNDNRKSQNIPSRDSSRGRSNQQHVYQQSGGGRKSQGRGEREDAINLARNFTSQKQSPSESSPMYPNMLSKNNSRSASREHSAPNSRNSSMRRETPDIELNAVNQLMGSNISEKDLEFKSMSSIKEYLSLKRLSEPVQDITSLCNDSNVHIYISTAINCALEISSQSDQFAIGNLFCHLIANNIIRIDHFFKGLYFILEAAEDIEIDVPLFWDYIGDVLAPIFVELPSNKRKQFLLDSAKPCKTNKMTSKLIVKVVKAIAKLTSEIKANELWSSSDLHWEDFLSSDEDINKFVEENGVSFTMKGPAFERNSTNFDETLERFSNEVYKLVRERKSNDEIQSLTSKYFNASQTINPRFTSALFRAVIRGCLTEPSETSFSYSLDSSALVAISPLLVKFFGGDPDVELQALIQLQELMQELEHPSKLLFNIFELLYENSVISHDAFLQWETADKNNPAKAVAVTSVTRFLTWLRENEDDYEDNDNTGS